MYEKTVQNPLQTFIENLHAKCCKFFLANYFYRLLFDILVCYLFSTLANKLRNKNTSNLYLFKNIC